MISFLRATLFSLLMSSALVTAGCGPAERSAEPSEGTPRAFAPIDPAKAVFWGRFTEEVETELAAIVTDFNGASPGLPIAPEYVGGYGEIYKKTLAAIHAGKLPSMAVAYESMTAEYIAAGAAAPLGDYLRDETLGLDLASFEDFFPAVLDTNKFEAFDGKMYSFPFAKSVLVLYYNKAVLREAGLSGEAPKTWDDFLAMCRAVKSETGKYGYALAVDCSTVDGIIMSMGGELMRDGATLFDSPAALEAFRLFETLAVEDLAYRISPGTYDDHVAFGRDDVAFILRTSASRTGLAGLLGFDADRWGIAPLPQKDPANPKTVLFGPNIVVFNTGEAHQRRAWEFVRHFTSRETTVRWALATGYLPLRRSAADDPAMQALWAEWPDNRVAFDCLEFAKPEPNVAGWQEVRGLVEEAQTAVLAKVKSAEDAARELKAAADRALSPLR